MTRHNDIGRQELRQEIKDSFIQYAGNSRLKIFGLLSCSSGKRMRERTGSSSKQKRKPLPRASVLVVIVCLMIIVSGN
jgi:hypothetical protein